MKHFCCYILGFGMMDEVGHIDFYPNGGENQPGCQQSVSNFMSTAAEDGLEGKTASTF